MKKWVTRVGLLEVNDPKEYASSTYKGQAEEENVITKREMVEDHNISHLQTAEEIRTELVSSYSEIENISVTGEPYEDTVSASPTMS